MNDHPERSSNRRSRNASVTSTSRPSSYRNKEESGDEYEREQDKDGKRPSRRRSKSSSSLGERKGKYRPMAQRNSMIKPNTKDEKKKKDNSSKDEKHKFSNTEGRSTASLLPNDETEKESRRRRSVKPIAAEYKKRRKSQRVSFREDSTKRGNGSRKGRSQSPTSPVPTSSDTEKESRRTRRREQSISDRKQEKSLITSSGSMAIKRERHHSGSDEDLPQHPRMSLRSGNETEKKTRLKKSSEAGTVEKRILKPLTSSTGDTARKSERSNARSLESEKRYSIPGSILPIPLPVDKSDDEDDYIRCSVSARNETQKNEKQYSQLEFGLSNVRKHSSRSMIHETDRNAPPQKYVLLRDQSTTDYSLVSRERSRLRDRSVSEPAIILDCAPSRRVNFLKDDPKNMTFARRIALSLVKKKWYNPKAGADGPSKEDLKLGENEEYAPGCKSRVTKYQYPSLERAWAYFEHVSLPRFTVEPKPDAPQKNLCHRMIRKMSKANKSLDRAEPGENKFPTKLYSPIFTPLSQMGDFGLGIGLYFSTLRAMTVLTLLAGLINIPNLIYFSGPEYSDSQPGVNPLLQGSAICTKQVWVPCPNCTTSDFEDAQDRLAVSTLIAENGNTTNLTFALRNTCVGATLQQGLVSYGTLICVLLGVVAVNAYQKYREIKYDEDEQTAQDYSIIISNPPPDATDPKEWREFFRAKFDADTTVCTIAVDNDFLVRSLLERRECMQKIELLLKPGTSVDELNLARIAAQIERERSFFGKLLASVAPGIPELLGRVTILASRVQGLAQQDYPASNVFITFETEAAQRKVLSALSVGVIAANGNKTKVLSKTPEYLFRSNLVLNVKEPEEPSTVRWQDLNAKFTGKLKALLTTTLATIGAIALIALLINILNGLEATWAALAIAGCNVLFPLFAKLLTQVESHASESSRQTSLYFKIAIFRWVNTAIIITVITPFTKTLDNTDGLIRSIGTIFFADIVTTNAFQFLDPVGHIRRHFLAPRAATQDLMNLNMQGQEFELAERYTNMTKILFLTFWYCSIYPGTLFMCSFALFVNFFMDRFSLMRTWKRVPALGTTISKFSRRYFFSTALVAMAVVSSYYWSGFPFDNLCRVDGASIDPMYYGTWTVTTLGSGTEHNAIVTIFSNDVYKYCFQDLLRVTGRSFPAIPQFQPEGSEWMTQDQEQVTTLYGWTSVGVLAIIALNFLWGWYQSFRGLFRSTYDPNGDDQEINFSDASSISAYVPQVSSTVYSYPLFACNIDGIDEVLFDWTDPDRPHSYYDLTKDAEELLRGLDVSHKHVFSTVSHWPPLQKSSKADPYK